MTLLNRLTKLVCPWIPTYLDTSGSMYFALKIAHQSADFAFDHNKVVPYSRWNEIAGGGGNFAPVFKHATENGYRKIFIITDEYHDRTPIPKNLKVSLIHV